VPEEFRVERPHVGVIQPEGRAADRDVGPVGRLVEEESAGDEHPERLRERSQQDRERQVLEYLERDHGSQGACLLLAEELEEVLFANIESLLAALLHEARTEVRAKAGDPGLGQQPEELAPATAQIRDGLRARKLPYQVDVGGLLFADCLG